MTFGYIDPASGSMVLQILLGGAAAVLVALKMWWRRVLRFLHLAKPDEDEDVTPAEPASTAYESEALDPASEPAARR